MENGYFHMKILYLSLQRFLQCYADFLTKYTIHEGHIMIQLQFIGAQITDDIGFTPSRLSGMTYNLYCLRCAPNSLSSDHCSGEGRLRRMLYGTDRVRAK
jgi:hypothetical protein